MVTNFKTVKVMLSINELEQEFALKNLCENAR